ncbi:MAG: hypothetical protein WC758_07730 [Candidatus Woesearchaeota archaeon]|jgi:hypothetical protein
MKKIFKLIFLGISIVGCFFLSRLNVGFKDLLSMLLPILSFLFGYVLSKKEIKKVESDIKKEVIDEQINKFPSFR